MLTISFVVIVKDLITDPSTGNLIVMESTKVHQHQYSGATTDRYRDSFFIWFAVVGRTH